MIVFKGWQKTSLIEYPGKVATVLFTGGCNFRCPYCYNAPLVLDPGSIPDLAAGIVLEYLRENRRLYQAVVVSGGEPTLQPELAWFCERVGELGLLRGLETNGSSPAVLRDLMKRGLIDYAAMDVKAPLSWPAYRRAAGLRDDQRELLERVRESLELLRGSAIDYELRATAVPGLHTEQDLLELAGELKGARRFALQAFEPRETLDPAAAGAGPFPPAALEEVASRVRPWFERFELRGP